MIAALILAIVPVEGLVFQDIMQQYDSISECVEAKDDFVDLIEELDYDRLLITKRELHTEVYDLNDLTEYRFICSEDGTLTFGED